jgi:hypothetical protein
MWQTVAVLTLQWPARPQLASTVHVLPSVVQAPPTKVQSVSVEHAALERLHLPLRTQAASPKQGALSRLHRPGCVGHSAGSAPAVWQTALVNVQRPSFGHSAVAPGVVQTWLSTLQCPGMVAQSPSTLHVAVMFVLQCPACGQSPATKQEEGTTEQVPARVGHSAGSEPAIVQALPPMLQVPVLGQSLALPQLAPLLLHLPGGQVVLSVHIGHSSPVHGQTPGGSQSVVQSEGLGGTQVGATILHTWLRTLLHAWPVMPAHVCGVTPLHVWAPKLSQVWLPMLIQVCGVAGTQLWVEPPPHV